MANVTIENVTTNVTIANVTITSGGNYSTYTLSAPLTNGQNIDFLNNAGTAEGVLVLTDNGQGSAFNLTTLYSSGTISGYGANLGGSILNFEPVTNGLGGDQVTIQVVKDLFADLFIGGTVNADYISLVDDIQAAALSGNQMLVLPDNSVDLTPGTRDAAQQQVIEDAAQALFGTAAATDGVTLDIAFSDRTNPNSNIPFVDAVITAMNGTVNPCFTAGTRILTVRGEVAVEDLRVGDLLITHAGEEQAITWIGHRLIDIAVHSRPETVQPVMIAPDALGDGVPACRLLVSPDHGLFLDGVLVPAKALLNWTTIRQDNTAAQVEYYHLELGRHDIIFAAGTPAESYLDTGHRSVFDNAETQIIAHPALMQQRRETNSCAPLCLDGPILAAIRHRIAARQIGIQLAGF
jgi:hypothetical protein